MNTEPIAPVSPLELRIHALRKHTRRWSLVAFPLMLAAAICVCGQIGLWYVRPEALPLRIDADSTANYGPWERLILAQFDPRLQTQVALDVTRGINPTQAMTIIAAAATATAMAPTETASGTPTTTATITMTDLPSVTWTLTASPSPSATETGTASVVPSVTATASSTTFMASATSSATATGTASSTASVTPTPSPTASRTATRTAAPPTPTRTATPVVVAVVPTPTPSPFVPPQAQVDIYADIRLVNTTPGTQLQFSAICGNLSSQIAAAVGMNVSMNGANTPIPSLGDLLGGGVIEVPYISPSPVQNITIDVIVFCAASQPDPNPGNNTRTLRIVVAPLALPPTPTPFVPTPTLPLPPTNTPVVPATPTDTPAVPATPTNTPLVPPTDTPTSTNTPPVPPTDTPTPTPTDTPAVPPTDTPTPTDTPAVPPTDTPTPTPTDTPVVPPTDTPTATATDTPVVPPTDTPTPTDTPAVPPTDTPTATATDTPVVPPTDTPTATATDTPIVPPTDTPTPTPTNTPPGLDIVASIAATDSTPDAGTDIILSLTCRHEGPGAHALLWFVDYPSGVTVSGAPPGPGSYIVGNDPAAAPGLDHSGGALVTFPLGTEGQSFTFSTRCTSPSPETNVGNNLASIVVTVNSATPTPTSTATPTPTATPVAMTNNILREVWYGVGDIGGVNVDELLVDPRYPNAPNACFTASEFDAPFNQGDDYAQRMRALLVPPATGEYTFWLTSDNEGRLYLSSDESPSNAIEIATVSPFVTVPYDYTQFSSQQSAPITLQAGRAYYIQALHTEGTVTDFLRVAWQGPTIPAQTTIAGQYLTTTGMSCAPVANTPTPTSTPAAPPTDTPTSTPTDTPTPTSTPTPIAMTNNILREVWYGVVDGAGGVILSALLGDPRYPNAPNACFTEVSFDAPQDQADDLGQRMRALLVPPGSGDYTFWIASDNASRLSLSTDANPANAVVIASSSPFNDPRFNYDQFPEQQSVAVSLEAGRPYYIEAVHLDGIGGDFLRVAWQGPTVPARETIAGQYLTTTGMSCTPVPNTATPTPTDTPTSTPTATPLGVTANMCLQASSTSPTGTLYDSGGLAGNYGFNENCAFLIQPTGGGTIRLDFTQFNVELNFDTLRVYDGSNTSGVLLGTYTGGTLPPTLWAASGSMYLVFQSDATGIAPGFTATWSTAAQGSEYVMCNSLTTSTLSSGTLYDSGGPAFNYDINQNCAFLIQPAGGGTIRLDFAQFNVELNFDTLRVYDGSNTSGVLLGAYTSGTLPPTLWAASGSMYLVFQSDATGTAPGFTATWSTAAQGSEYVMCNSLTTSTLSNGTLYDSGGPAFNYEISENCAFLIQPSGGGIIQLDFSQFSTENNYDFLRIYDGINASGTLLGTYTGSTLPTTVWAGSGSMYLLFRSDAVNVQPGFVANWSILTPVPGFVRAINFGGPALVVDGNAWEGQTSPHYTLGSGDINECVGGSFVPPTTRNRQEMMRCLTWDSTGTSTITMTNILNGTYDVYFWRWEDNFADTVDHFVQGALVADDLVINPGAWRRMGPFTATVTDGTITLNSVGGHQNISGLEVWQVGTGGPGI